MNRCASPDCETPNPVAHVAVADFHYCSRCYLEITRGGDPSKLCAGLAPKPQGRSETSKAGQQRRKAGP